MPSEHATSGLRAGILPKAEFFFGGHDGLRSRLLPAVLKTSLADDFRQVA